MTVHEAHFVYDLFYCPSCHGTELEAVTDTATTDFRCTRCQACWHFELGWVRLVTPGRRPPS